MNGIRLANLSLLVSHFAPGMEGFVGAVEGAFVEVTAAGVDRPDIGGVGRRVEK